MAKQRYQQGGQAGRRIPAKRKSPKKKSGTAGKLVLGAVTFCNLLLSVLLTVLRRQEVLHAVQEDEDVKVLLTTQKKTKM